MCLFLASRNTQWCSPLVGYRVHTDATHPCGTRWNHIAIYFNEIFRFYGTQFSALSDCISCLPPICVWMPCDTKIDTLWRVRELRPKPKNPFALFWLGPFFRASISTQVDCIRVIKEFRTNGNNSSNFFSAPSIPNFSIFLGIAAFNTMRARRDEINFKI